MDAEKEVISQAGHRRGAHLDKECGHRSCGAYIIEQLRLLEHRQELYQIQRRCVIVACGGTLRRHISALMCAGCTSTAFGL